MKLHPGQMILERVLAERFGVSKTPVREALALLEQDGFVESMHGRGYQIAPISLQDVLQTIELRLILERGTAELAAQRIRKEELETLLKMVELPVDEKDEKVLATFPYLNRRFHDAIAKAARNRLLYDATVRVLEQMERVIHMDVAQIRRSITGPQKEHIEIVEAIGSGDPTRARKCMERHILNAKANILKAL